MTAQTSSLSREERDLLVRLDTKMTAVERKLNDIDGSWSGRLLNIESNAVSKIELRDLDARVGRAEECLNDINLKIQSIRTWGSAAIVALGIVEFLAQLYFKV